jgi:hypothetical protein
LDCAEHRHQKQKLVNQIPLLASAVVAPADAAELAPLRVETVAALVGYTEAEGHSQSLGQSDDTRVAVLAYNLAVAADNRWGIAVPEAGNKVALSGKQELEDKLAAEPAALALVAQLAHHRVADVAAQFDLNNRSEAQRFAARGAALAVKNDLRFAQQDA